MNEPVDSAEHMSP